MKKISLPSFTEHSAHKHRFRGKHLAGWRAPNMPLWLILKMAFWIHHLQECYCASDFSGIALMLDENQKKLALFIVHLQTKDDVFSHCNYKQCCKRKASSKEMHLQTLFISRSPP